MSDDHHVVYYDQRGAGLSERMEAGALTLSDHIAELDAVIDLVSLDKRSNLIGHSWGAILATAYLSGNPEKVTQAVLIEPGFLDSKRHARWIEESQRYMSGLIYWTEAVLNGFRAQHVIGPDSDASEDFLIGQMVGVFANHQKNPYHCGAGYTAPHWRFGAGSSRMLDAFDPLELDRIAAGATQFEGHVLLMAGACNTWTGATLQRLHLPLFKDADVVVIENAGHDVIWDNPTASIATIRGFLSKARRSPMNNP